jgi:hypothetical protein
VVPVEHHRLPPRGSDLGEDVYEEAGVQSYWLLDPKKETLTVLELVDGAYVERDVVVGEKVFDATLPFPARIVPAELNQL